MRRALPLLLAALLLPGCITFTPAEEERPLFGPSSEERPPIRHGIQVRPPEPEAPIEVSGLTLDTLNLVRHGENAMFLGLIRNDGNVSATSNGFDIEILGADGGVIRNQTGWPLLEFVEPGQRVPFRWDVHDPEGNVTGARVHPRGVHDAWDLPFALDMGTITRAENGTFVVPARNSIDGPAIAVVASAHYDAQGALVAVGAVDLGVQMWAGGNATLYVDPAPAAAEIARSEFWGHASHGVIHRGTGMTWID